MNEILKLKDFLINPNPETESSDLRSKISSFASVLGINIGLVTIAVGVQYGFKYVGLIDITLFPSLNERNIAALLAFLVTILVVPVVEEVAFRRHLIPTKRNITISIKALLIFLAFQLIPMSKSIISISIVSLVVGILVSAYLYFNKGIEEIWKHNFSKIFYLTTLLFGFIHIINHKLSLTNLIFAPIIVAPQIILGFNAGYLRVKYGFKWGLWLHIVHNLVFFGVYLFAINPDLLKLNKYEFVVDYPQVFSDLKDYSLIIDETKDGGLSDYHITDTEICFENTKAKEVFIKLSHAKNARVIFESEVLANKLLNLSFLNKSADKPNSRKNRHFVIDRLLKKYNVKAKIHIIPEGNWLLSKRENAFGTSKKAEIHNQNTNNQDFVELKDATVKDLVNKINVLYSINCIALIDKRHKYNIKIPTNDINALKKILFEEYGFEFQKLNAKTDCFYIGSQDEKFDLSRLQK